MSNILGTYTRAVIAYANANTNIPYPQTITSGTNDGVTGGQLIDSTKDFIALGVKIGDIVYNTTGSASATVVNVLSGGKLQLSTDIFLITPQSYILYQNSSQTTIGNRGCVLYIMASGNITVETIGGDIASFEVLKGQILPVQITKLISSVTSHIALW